LPFVFQGLRAFDAQFDGKERDHWSLVASR
jgi:hypothetical protein